MSSACINLLLLSTIAIEQVEGRVAKASNDRQAAAGLLMAYVVIMTVDLHPNTPEP